MAVKTLGTTGQTSIAKALAFLSGYGQLANADVATLNTAILDDINVAHPNIPASFTVDGQLFIPNRGVLRVLPGDWVGVDTQGWPILVSKNSIANGLWVHS